MKVKVGKKKKEEKVKVPTKVKVGKKKKERKSKSPNES